MALEIPRGTLEIPRAGVIPEVEAESLNLSQFPEFEGMTDAEVISLVTQTISPPSAPAAPPPSDDNFFPAMAYGADSAQAALGAGIKALGQGLDIEGMEEYGRDLQERNLQEAQESAAAYTQINLDDVAFGDNVTNFVIQTLGETLPSMGIALGGAGVAAIGAIPLGLTGAAAGAVAGAGAFLPSALMGTGETQIKMESLTDDKNYEDPSTALAGGLFIGALDTAAAAVPALKLLGRGFTKKATTEALENSGISPDISSSGVETAVEELAKAGGDASKATSSVINMARDISRGKPGGRGRIAGAGIGGAQQFALEGLTEGTQEAIGTLLAEGSTGKEDEEFLSSLLEAAVKGGIAGFGPGAVVGALKSGKDIADTEVDKVEEVEVSEAAPVAATLATVEADESSAVGGPAVDRTVNQAVVEPPLIDRNGDQFERNDGVLSEEIYTLKAEAAGIERMRNDVIKEATTGQSSITPEAEAFIRDAAAGAPSVVTNNLIRIAEENGVAVTVDTSPQDIFNSLLLKEQESQPAGIDADELNLYTERLSERTTKLKQYEAFINSSNNKNKYPASFKMLKESAAVDTFVQQLKQETSQSELDLTRIGDIENYLGTLEIGLRSGDNELTVELMDEAPSRLQLVGETLETSDDVSSIIGKLENGLQRLKATTPTAEAATVSSPRLFKDTFLQSFPKTLNSIDMTEPAAINNAVLPKREAVATAKLADAAGNKGPGRDGPPPRAIAGPGPQAALNRVNLYMKFMSSNKRLADKFKELRPMYNLVKEYNEEWFSIITRGIEGRTLALALPSEKKRAYRRYRNIADTLGIRIKFEGVAPLSGSRRAIIELPVAAGVTLEEKKNYINKVNPYQKDYASLDELKITDTEIETGIIVDDQSIVDALDQEQDTIDAMWDDVVLTKKRKLLNTLQKAYVDDGGVNIEEKITNIENNILAARQEKNIREALTPNEKDALFLQALNQLEEIAEKGLDTSLKQVRMILPAQIGIMEAVTDGRRQGYFPRMRNGDIVIRVFENVEERDDDGNIILIEGQPKMVKRVVYRRDVNAPLWQLGPGRKEAWAQKKYGEDLQKLFPTGEVEITFKSQDEASLVMGEEMGNLSILESILIHESKLNEEYSGQKVLFKGKLTDAEGRPIKAADGTEIHRIVEPDKFIRMLGEQYRQRKRAQMASGTFVHRKNIPGYITPDNIESYYDNAWAQYVTSLGRYTARTRVEDRVVEEQDRLKKIDKYSSPAERFYKSESMLGAATSMWDNTKSPQGAASALKSFAFYGFLGGNFSSSLLNLTQNFVTASLLYGAYGNLFQPKVSKAATAAARLSIYYYENQAFLKSDRENVAKILKKTGAARTIEEGRDQFDKLYILQERGTIGRINTQALSTNADITTDFWYDKLGLDNVERLAQSGLNPKKIQAFKRFAKNSKQMVDAVYSTSELANRIAAALATYNTIKSSPQGMSPLRDFARNTASGADSQGADRMVEIEDGMQYIVDESQFNLSAFNRPRLAFAGNGLAGVTLQFIPFVTMMLEVYANALTRYGGAAYGGEKGGKHYLTPQGRRTLAYLIIPQVIMGGMFGLPFADDMKEVIKALIRSPVGKSLDLQQSDMELVFYDIMIDILGPEGMSLAEAIARGPIKAWGGIDISQRVSLSPLRAFIEAGTGQTGIGSLLSGPSGAFFTNAIGKAFDAYERDDYGKAILRLTPLAAVQNLVNAWEAGEDGIYSGQGRLLTDGLEAQDLALMSLGFASEPVYRAREQLYRRKAYATQSNAIKDKYLDKILRLMVQRKNADSAEDKAAFRAEINELYKEVREHDRNQSNIHQKIDPSRNIGKTARTRYKDQVIKGGRGRGKEGRAIERRFFPNN